MERGSRWCRVEAPNRLETVMVSEMLRAEMRRGGSGDTHLEAMFSGRKEGAWRERRGGLCGERGRGRISFVERLLSES